MTLGEILVLGRKELRVLARDRQATALLFVMPGVFVFLLSLAVGDLYDAKTNARIKVAVERFDEGDAALRFVELLDERPEIEVVDFPAGGTSVSVFQERLARATVRVPAGFTERIRGWAASGEVDSGLEDARIEWAVSPGADAINQAIVRVSLTLSCIRVLQDEVEGRARDRAAEMETEVQQQMDRLGEALERMAFDLKDAVGQLESIQAQAAGGMESQRALARAAEAEQAMAREARLAREELAREELGADSLAGDEPGAATGGASVEARPLAIDVEALDARMAAEREALEADFASSSSLSSSMLISDDLEFDEEDLLVMGKDEEGKVILPNPVQQNVPGWSLFAMFFIVVPLSSALHRERLEGTTRRLLALGVPRATLLAGKVWPYVLLGFLQFTAMLLVGMFIVPLIAKDVSLELGPNPITLLPVTLACAFAATSYSLLVATLCRTSEQAAAFGASSVVILAAVGGVMIPYFMMPPTLQTLAHGSPIFWGDQAYLDVFLHGASVQDVALPIGILVGFGALCLAVAAPRTVR